MSLFENLPIDAAGYCIVTFPLTCCYASCGLSPLKEIGGSFDRYWELRKGYDNFRREDGGNVAPPLDKHDVILSGSQQFTFFTRHSRYPYYDADVALFARKKEIYEILDGNIVFELCEGDGQKTREELSATNFNIEHFGIADKFLYNVKVAYKLLAAQNTARSEQLRRLDGNLTQIAGDIRAEAFWQKLRAIIIEIKSRHPSKKVVLVMQGATLNDFTPEERKRLFISIRNNGQIDDVLFAFDNSMDRHTLQMFYGDPGLSHVFLTGLEWYFRSYKGMKKLWGKSKKNIFQPSKGGAEVARKRIVFRVSNIEGGAVVNQEENRSVISFAFRDDKQRVLYVCENQIEKPRLGGPHDLSHQYRGILQFRQRIPVDDDIVNCGSVRNPESMALIKGTYAFNHLAKT